MLPCPWYLSRSPSKEQRTTVVEYGTLAENGESDTARACLPSLAVPSTMQASLMARLDRLETAKWVAQIGSAIGREFSHELLVAPS